MRKIVLTLGALALATSTSCTSVYDEAVKPLEGGGGNAPTTTGGMGGAGGTTITTTEGGSGGDGMGGTTSTGGMGGDTTSTGGMGGTTTTSTTGTGGSMVECDAPIDQENCVSGTWSDGETDIDCGGTCAVDFSSLCGEGQHCLTEDDCEVGLVCAPPDEPQCDFGVCTSQQ